MILSIAAAGCGGSSGGADRQSVACRDRSSSSRRNAVAAGAVLTNFGRGSTAWDLDVQADGKIIAVGAGRSLSLSPEFGDVALARYQNDGRLDPSFGKHGTVEVEAGGGAAALAIQKDGKLVTAGGYGDFHSTWAFDLGRLTREGRPDPSFGRRGFEQTEFSPQPGLVGTTSASAVAMQPDGKIIVVGYNYIRRKGGFAAARYMSAGRLDPRFGTNGKVITIFHGSHYGWMGGAHAVALQADGKIVAVGTSGPDFALVRYLPDGRLDHKFGSGGRVLTHFGSRHSYASASGLVLQPDGKIIVGGSRRPGDSLGVPSDVVLARYLPNGELDASFGRGGRVQMGFGANRDYVVGAIALQPDGKIVVAGAACGARVDHFTSGPHDFALAR